MLWIVCYGNIYIFQLDVIFDYLSPNIENSTPGSQLRLHAISLSAIVLEEQLPNERLGSPIIAKFIAVGEKAVGVDLAKKFHVSILATFFDDIDV